MTTRSHKSHPFYWCAYHTAFQVDCSQDLQNLIFGDSDLLTVRACTLNHTGSEPRHTTHHPTPTSYNDPDLWKVFLQILHVSCRPATRRLCICLIFLSFRSRS